jgi:peroxiredoxin
MGAVVLALALLWIASPGPEHDDFEQAITGENTGEPEDAAAAGKAARLDFTLPDINGVDVKLASFKGKVIVLNFWATWCGPCRVEIPDLVALQEQYKDDVVVLGVLVQDPVTEGTHEFASKLNINYPLLDANDRTDFEDAYGPMWGIPVSIIIDRDGRIAKKHSGIASREQFEREIKALLSPGADT